MHEELGKIVLGQVKFLVTFKNHWHCPQSLICRAHLSAAMCCCARDWNKANHFPPIIFNPHRELRRKRMSSVISNYLVMITISFCLQSLYIESVEEACVGLKDQSGEKGI